MNLKLDGQGRVTYVSPVLKNLCDLSVGDKADESELNRIAQILCSALEMAAGRKNEDTLLQKLATEEVTTAWQPPDEPVTVSFSGGVADCIETEKKPLEFGDIGIYLGRAIRQSSLCQGEYILGQETIRATVIGAGCHSTQLSGSTVFYRNTVLPKKNLPVVCVTMQEQESRDFADRIREKLASSDSQETVLALTGYESPDYGQVTRLAQQIAEGFENRPVFVCLQGDMAKALGQRLSLLLPGRACLCLDRLKFTPESYLDIGLPVGPCFPVVIKTLVLSKS